MIRNSKSLHLHLQFFYIYKKLTYTSSKNVIIIEYKGNTSRRVKSLMAVMVPSLSISLPLKSIKLSTFHIIFNLFRISRL